MTEEEMNQIEVAMAQAWERGHQWLDNFAKEAPSYQIELLASILYKTIQCDPYGYPNGLPTWDELPDIDSDDKLGYDKQRYIEAMNRVIDLIPYLSEELK